jgi:hypothetical protein
MDGTMLIAMPLKMCLKFRPPTIAVVYKLDRASKTKRDKKYIHEISIDSMTARTDLRKLCDKLCE